MSDGKRYKKAEPWTDEDDKVLVSRLREMRQNDPSNRNVTASEARKIHEELSVCGGGANTMF